MDWLSQIRNEMKGEVSALINDSRSAWAEVRPRQVQPTQSQRVEQFLNIPIPALQQRAMANPQEFQTFMDTNLRDVKETMGMNEMEKLSEFYRTALSQPAQTPDIMQTDLQSELMQMIGAPNDAGLGGNTSGATAY